MPAERSVLIAAPLAIEAWTLRRNCRRIPAARVVRTGIGLQRSKRAARRFAATDHDAFAVAGFGGSLGEGLRPGEVFVAAEIVGAAGNVACRGTSLLIGEFRRNGVHVHCGTLYSSSRVVHGRHRAALARDGAQVVDMESLAFALELRERPFTAMRAIVDTPERPITSAHTVPGTFAAMRVLRELPPVLRRWAAATGPRSVLVADVGHPDAVELRSRCDLLLVAGCGTDSLERRLLASARRAGTPAHVITDVSGVELDWLPGTQRIGLVVGASSPSDVVADLVDALRGLGEVDLTWSTRDEEVQP